MHWSFFRASQRHIQKRSSQLLLYVVCNALVASTLNNFIRHIESITLHCSLVNPISTRPTRITLLCASVLFRTEQS